MKLPLNPKTASISLAAIGVAFIGGLALASHQVPQKPIVALKTAADMSTAQSARSPTSTVASITQPAVPSPTTTTPSTTSTTRPSNTTITAQPSTSTSPTTSTSTTTPTAPTVTAVSAIASDWYDGPTHTNPDGSYTTQRFQDCTYTYSDGSIQKTNYRLEATSYNADGKPSGTTASISGGDDCTLATAPKPR
jgi:outer membrane biosynthesis protein TonB